jgi:hypothetical protein
MWLIPLVWGWYSVGSHHGRRRDVIARLRHGAKDIKSHDEGITNDNDDSANWDDEAIIPLDVDPHDPIGFPTGQIPHSGVDKLRTRFGILVGGDELLDGPFYNYARSRTWLHLARVVMYAYEKALCAEQPFGPTLSTTTQVTVELKSEYKRYDHRSQSVVSIQTNNQVAIQVEDSKFAQIMTMCGLDESKRKRFAWKETPKKLDLLTREILPFAMAMVLQGIFGWTALLIVYHTPTIGIGCRSLICLTYTLSALGSSICLVIASRFSDSWSFQYERRHGESDHRQYAEVDQADIAHGIEKVATNSEFATLSIFFRMLGKMLAVLNAFYLITACFLEFAGVYNSCYCKSSRMGLRGRAYLSFLSADDSVRVAKPYWISATVITMCVVGLVCFVYFPLVTRHTVGKRMSRRRSASR